MKSFFGRLGGKSKTASKIVKYIPKGMKKYVFPFTGAGNIFLRRKQEGNEVEILNDLDKDIYYIWSDMKKIGEKVEGFQFKANREKFKK